MIRFRSFNSIRLIPSLPLYRNKNNPALIQSYRSVKTAAVDSTNTDNTLKKKSVRKSTTAAANTTTNNADTTNTNSPLPSNTIIDSSPSSAASGSISAAIIAATYQKKTQREHILHRPEPYVGSMQKETREMWIPANNNNNSIPRMELRTVTYVPALVHIFDEILVNAADNRHRNQRNNKLTSISITINPSTNTISVMNNGSIIPIQLHPIEQIYVPELIFGHLLTSSNYNDNEARLTGGRHGYGAKLTNIFSTEFTIEISDKKLLYQQKWSNNMSIQSKPIINKLTNNSNSNNEYYTKITFQPDLTRFNESELTADTLLLMYRRIYDIAGCISNSGIRIELNGKLIPIHSFQDYVLMYTGKELLTDTNNNNANNTANNTATATDTDIESTNADTSTDNNNNNNNNNDNQYLFHTINSNWQFAIGPSIISNNSIANSSNIVSIRDISFVNTICTTRGGTHIQYLSDRINQYIMQYIEKHYKSLVSNCSMGLIRSQYSLFLNCNITNPSFDSQTKDILITPSKIFNLDQSIQLSNLFYNKLIAKTTIIQSIIDLTESRQKLELIRKTRLLTNSNRYNSGGRKKQLLIPKLDDANAAGTIESNKCTLILTEGDSAKALVLAGLSIIGRDYYGIFPLKGKLLNVRDSTHKTVLNNIEITNLIQIIGLDHNCTYSTESERNKLRYGRVMLMTDQDTDGSHIKGLFINFIHHFWPQLIYSNQFIEEFITAIIRVKVPRAVYNKSIIATAAAENNNNNTTTTAANSNTKSPYETLTFHTIPQYESWKSSMNPTDLSKCNIKYYKGLGTNTLIEAKEYFQSLSIHRIKFQYTSTVEDELISMLFSKSTADQRKNWLLTNYSPSLYIDHSKLENNNLTYNEFFNSELIRFSAADNIRSIPSIIDGLKPVQRKILFACFERGQALLNSDIKVAQLSGYISEKTVYHHGEQSLHLSIINMASEYIGSNNLSLLQPLGQFGTRYTGGKDSASPRYIYTKLYSITRLLFNINDDPLLDYRDEDGISIEPQYYIPILPLVLINGSNGIGTGFSTDIPSFNPIDLIQYIRNKLTNNSNNQLLLKPWILGFTGSIELNPTDSTQYITTGRIKKLNSKTIEITELPIGKWTADYKEYLNSLILNNNDINSNSNNNNISIISYSEHHTVDRIKFLVQLSPADLALAESSIGGLIKSFKLTSNLSLNNMHGFNSAGLIQKYLTIESILEEFYTVRIKYYSLRKKNLLSKLQYELTKLNYKIRFIQLIISQKLIINSMNKSQLIQSIETAGFALYNNNYDYLLNIPLYQLTSDRVELLLAESKSINTEIIELESKSIEQLYLTDLNQLEFEWKLYAEKRLETFNMMNNKSNNDIESAAATVNKKRSSNKKSIAIAS